MSSSAIASPSSPVYNCEMVLQMPYMGTEIALLGIVYVAVITTFAVTFLDIGLKQMWPETFMTKTARDRIAKLKLLFPKAGKSTKSTKSCNKEEDEDDNNNSEETSSSSLEYDRIVAPDAYVAGRCIDDDLVHTLANDSAFESISGYCSSTVRGYAMLSMTIMCSAMSLGYIWCHNGIVDKNGNSWWNLLSLGGYLLFMLTGVVMCHPNGETVHRKANILLWSSIPMDINGSGNPLVKLHTFGVSMFVVFPLVGHTLRCLFSTPETFPNRTGAWIGISWQISAALVYGLTMNLANSSHSLIPSINRVTGKKLAILGETFVLFASLLAFIQYELFATAYCVNMVSTFHSLTLMAFSLPFILCVGKWYWGVPESYATEPSVMLMNGGTPVATSGPVSVLDFNEENVTLPVVKNGQ